MKAVAKHIRSGGIWKNVPDINTHGEHIWKEKNRKSKSVDMVTSPYESPARKDRTVGHGRIIG